MEEKSNNDVIEKRKNNLKKFFFGWIEDNYDKAFIGVLILAFILRFLVFLKTMDQAVWFDAAEYMSTAKYWAGIGNMSDVWYYRRGFFFPLFFSLFFRFGLGDTAVRFAIVLFSTGIVAISYFLIRDMFNKKYALFASVGVACSWVMLFFTGRPMTSIPATFFLLLSLFFFWKGYELKQGNKFIYLFALFFTLSVLTRMQMLMFIPVFFIFIFIKEKFSFLKNKSLWIALLIFFLTMFPLFIMYNQNFGNPITDIMSHYLGIGAEVQRANLESPFSKIHLYLFDLPYVITGKIPPSLIEALFQPLFLFLIIGSISFFTDLFIGFDKIFKDKNIQKKLFVFLWIIFPLLLLGYMDVYAQQRYTMPQHPFLFLIIAIPLFKGGGLIQKHLKFNKKLITPLILIVFIIVLIPNLIWGNQLIENKLTSYYETKLAGEWIKQNSNLEDIIITNSFPQISYYSERRVATFGDCYNNPEAHTPACTQEEFYSFVEDVKPRFLILSGFQNHPDWVLNYPQNRSDIWTPIKAYPENSQQPILVIYESNYNAFVA